MAHPIAFVSRTTEANEAEWIEILASALPDETILSIKTMTAEQKTQAEVAIVANPDPADIATLTGLRWIHSLWAGVERLVAELGTTAPPIVRLTDPELSRVMAEAVLAWTYYLQRDMPAYRRNQQSAVWKELEYRHPKDVTVGILGLGTLGAAAAARLRQASFNTMGWSRSPKSVEGIETLSGEPGLKALLEKSDILVCLVPLTADTKGLLNKTRLNSMKKDAAVINFARGAVIVADDLLDALDTGHLSHAVLDVFEQEPLSAQSPFWSHPNVTVLPHISAPTNRQTSASIVAGNIQNWRRTGVLPATVDMARGY
ncbi:2-hydroxyacid dehydrogenase [Agrobacterium rubi]|uniref:Glyoxylate/hydroxypyruvate reductase A n=2 Tax=Agrobacterium rubi TaxID=28099 RepID=A0AAE7UQ55_9HYPH|nr:glyoxylate/hydroxypyruvate reductase A [Agrobacterium rubi]MBP1878798.1 glyoxylate/hydroxypyruvate reductase A [Agrobacterium rubi]MCL6652843.1 glyoxylate/hydroxypyruvate reductase A [Agrobacterium rubi]NTE88581.1 glyoxylate/hydroxypyruvate reductase A [Agrobacterium rubi]NTF04409.1 glyoxylate/hydroxypyruvate reductase A [Agrobacterium rubi]NTF09942.1 glyoxylate/hydroxypyruvate reductase A [Agrobacterium rubi]